MARVYGDCHRCGEPVKGMQAANRKAADWQALHRTFTCDPCRDILRKQAAVVAAASNAANGLPPLKGSDAQVAWGETIRHEMVKEIVKTIGRVHPDVKVEERVCDVFHMSRSTVRAWDRILLALEIIDQQDQAHWWIDRRGENPAGLVGRVAMEALLPEQVTQIEVKEALELAAVESSTVIPEGIPLQSPMVVEIGIRDHGKTIVTNIPDRLESFRSVVKGLKYTWDPARISWSRRIDDKAGPIQDRLVELAHRLLAAGFKVCLQDPVVRARAIAGDFAPEQTRWIVCCGKPFDGWFAICFPKSEDLYTKARKLPGSKYYKECYCVVVPPAAYESVGDFAQLYGFKFDELAAKVFKKAQEADRAARMEKLSIRLSGPKKDGLKEILAAPVEIPDDLRD